MRKRKQAWLLIVGQVQLQAEDLVNLEIFILVRLLIQLGYLAPSPELKGLISPPAFSWDDVKSLRSQRPLLIKKINQALELTQL